MFQSQCLKVKLKAGTTDKFINWIKTAQTRKDELQVCVEAEGIISEHLFLERATDGDYIVFYTKAKDLVACGKAFQESTRKLDIEMKEMIDTTWDRSAIKTLEPLLDI